MNHLERLEKDPEFSLEVNAKRNLKITEQEKKFLEHYIQTKNIKMAGELSGLEMANEFYLRWDIQEEIRRINRALYHRRFAQKLLSLDEIGGFLTTLITDEHIPIGEQLKTRDKLKVIDMLMELIKLKEKVVDDPRMLMQSDIEVQIKELSVDTIQNMLASIDKKKEVKQLDSVYNHLTIEEKAYLKSLPAQELLKLVEDLNEE